ncbi:MAG: BamA/TamA family outer membrane protein [Chitinophagaceae bacterium]
MHKTISHRTTILFVFLLSVVSCTVVRKYPKDTPFHFENNIKIVGEENKEKLSFIKSNLFAQIEDSAQIRVASKIPWPSFPWFIPSSVMEYPTVYNSQPIEQSIVNMRNMLSSLGYRKSEIRYDTAVQVKKEQQRVKVNFLINTGPLYKIDTVIYLFSDSVLQSIVTASTTKSLLSEHAPFSYEIIDQEINRITDLYQNNGYVKISKEDIIAEVDTVNTTLLNGKVNPFQFSSTLAEAQSKEKQATVKLYFRLRAYRDSTHVQQYTIGRLTVYADLKAEDRDTLIKLGESDTSKVIIHSLYNTFNSKFIKDNIQLQPGSLFKRDDYNRTLNNFNKLGTWQSINMISETNDKEKKIDYVLKLQPAKRQYFSIDLEGSSILNTSQLVQVGSGRVGIANNFTLRNRNIGKRGIQLENSLRTGIEFNNFQKILSGEITLTNRLTFPRMVAPVSDKFKTKFQQAKTVFSADVSYIDRFRFFRLNTFNTFVGYEWKPNANTTWQFKPLNLEFTQFRPDSLFIESIRNFPLLLYTYNNGLIIGMNALYNKNLTPNSTKNLSLLKIYAEESGLVTGALFYEQTRNGKYLSNLYRFVKLDAEFKHIANFKKSSLHFRAFAGVGLALSTASRRGQVTLPFFKSYMAGGPNSMRGWPLRKLGIGSNIFYDTVAAGTFNDKYADMQLEGNLEYRFNLFQFYGFWMRGAVFTDVGNIWFRNDLDGTLKNAGFKFNRLGRDLAIASGFGARVDFNYFLLRFDLGFPIKDPRYGPSNIGNSNIERFYSPSSGGWFVDNHWSKPVFQFAIGYPF